MRTLGFLGIMVVAMCFCGCTYINDSLDSILSGPKTPCQSGDYAQCEKLGEMLEVSKRRGEMLKTLPYIEKFCNEQGNGQACETLAESYVKSKTLQRDNAKALEYYKKACDTKENEYTCDIYEVNKQFLEKKCFQKASIEACNNVFIIDYSGINLKHYIFAPTNGNIKYVFVIDENEKNILRKKLAPQYLKQAENLCDEKQDKFYCNNVADYYSGKYEYSNYGIEKNFTKWREYMQKACKLGDSNACDELKKNY